MVKVNGQEMDVAGMTVLDFVIGANYNPTRIAVEINGDIVPKSTYGERILEDGEIVEVVSFVGGG